MVLEASLHHSQLAVYADQLRDRRLSAYDGECSILLAHLWGLCKELAHQAGWEWDVALDGICLAAVVASGPEERELFVRQLAQEMVPREFVTRERLSLVEAGLWMFALFDSERAVRCFVGTNRTGERMIED